MIFKDKYLKKIINIILFYTSKGYKILGATSFFTNQEIEDILKLAFPKDKSTILEEQELIRITGDVKFENELTFDKLLNRLYNQNNSIEKDYFLFLAKDNKYIFVSLIGNEFTFIDFNRNFEKRKEIEEVIPEKKEEPKKIEKQEPSLFSKLFSMDVIVFSVYGAIAMLEILLLERSINEAGMICKFLWIAFFVIYALSYKKMMFKYVFLTGLLGSITRILIYTAIFSIEGTSHSYYYSSNYSSGYDRVIGQMVTTEFISALFYSLYFSVFYNIQKLKEETKVNIEK